jgi:hypothetical protein
MAMAAEQVPAVTKAEFDELKPELRLDLERWWEDEREDLESSPPMPDLASDPLWEGLPEIDSKAVVKASPVVRKHMGIELDPRLIRKGGYSSFDELVDDLFPKLRETCPDRHPPAELPLNHEGIAK